MSITVVHGLTPANTGQLATTASITLSSASLAPLNLATSGSFILNGYYINTTGSTKPANTPTTIFVSTGSNFQNTLANIRDAVNVTASAANSATNYADLQGVTSITGSNTITFRFGAVGQYVYPNVIQAENYVTISGSTTYFSGASMYGPSASTVSTGSWTSLMATADARVSVSGSVLGVAAFQIPRGVVWTTTASAPVESIQVLNPQGAVVAS